ncbi:unnamed protein product [Urochloa humidicola]
MADMILGTAQGAVGSLLGRLASVLGEEAQLLGGVRRDMQFIKDEMESMNGFLLHAAEATSHGDEDQRARAWMKQVADVAYASQNCVDLYTHSLGTAGSRSAEQAGLLSYLRLLPRLLWTLPARHRIAVQIRELKLRSREVGERRLRYGVEPPASMGVHHGRTSEVATASGEESAKDKEQEDARRLALAEAEPAPFSGLCVTCWMSGHDARLEKKDDEPRPRVIALLGHSEEARAHIARASYWNPWAASSRPSNCMAWIQLGHKGPVGQSALLRDILVKLLAPQAADQLDDIAKWDEKQLLKKIRHHLQGKKFLIVLHDHGDDSTYEGIKSAFPHNNCSPGSAILVTTRSLDVAIHLSPDQIFKVDSLYPGLHDYLTDFYLDKVTSLLNNNYNITHLEPVLKAILEKLVYQTHNCKLFLYALYVNPIRALEDFQSLQDNLVLLSSWNESQVIMFAYNGLSTNCQNCLRYLTIFSKNTTFRRTRLVRRWSVEGTVTKRGRLGRLVEADCCFDELVAHKFVMPKDTDVTGKVKSCMMHDLIHDLVTNIASYDSLHRTNLPLQLAHCLPIHNQFQLQEATQQVNAARSKVYRNICCLFKPSYTAEIDESNAIKILLESLPFAQVGTLEVLDLEDCKDLKNHHLKNICNHVSQLKYLSLRNTDITELPKQIDKLQYLETLDIRQTKVQAFAKNSVVLPKLKHLLAGCQNVCKRQNTTNSEESFVTVQMPKTIGTMTELQVLSHVAVFGSGKELIDIGNLLQLTKLGVVLNECQEPIMRHLYRAIEILPRLRSLSIRNTADNNNAEDMSHITQQLLMPPKYLQILQISGMIGLPKWIKQVDKLTKIALHETLLAKEEIVILGELARLCCLRLGEKSCSENELNFSSNGFQSLKFLEIECSDITHINFVNKSTPKLEKIVWSSTASKSLSGIEFLQSLKELNVKGIIKGLELDRVKFRTIYH